MKSYRLFFWAILIIELFVFPDATYISAQEYLKAPFSLYLYGEISSFAIGDPNNATYSYNHNSYFEYLRATRPDLISGGLETISGAAKAMGMEFKYRLSKRLAFGVALLGPTHLSNDSSIAYAVVGDAGPQTTSLSEKQIVKAGFSLLLTTYYSVKLGHRVSMFAQAGTGYYPAQYKITREYDIQYPLGGYSDGVGSWELSRSFPIGFHGGLGFSADLTRKFALVVEAMWRFAHTGHLRGVAQGTSNTFDAEGNLVDSASHQVSGPLYSYSADDLLIGARYESLAIYGTRPTEGGIDSKSNIRRANLDLSGYSISLGLRVKLF